MQKKSCFLFAFHIKIVHLQRYGVIYNLMYMKKQKIFIEQHLNSTAPNIIWKIISTEGGLSRWIADSVKEENGKFHFVWGDEMGHHEKRSATTLERLKNSHLRLRWDDETDPNAFMEIKMVRTEVTGGYTLQITDYALPEDTDSLLDIWDQNLDQLRQNTGL